MRSAAAASPPNPPPTICAVIGLLLGPRGGKAAHRGACAPVRSPETPASCPPLSPNLHARSFIGRDAFRVVFAALRYVTAGRNIACHLRRMVVRKLIRVAQLDSVIELDMRGQN